MKIYLSFLLSLVLAACVSSNGFEDNVLEQALKAQSNGIVVTANPHATKAGADVLRSGGSAVDAAIAIESVLSLVEPQSSGLAGGAFMVYFDNQSNQLSVYDGRETAPMNISKESFVGKDGEPMGFLTAKNSGLSTGVPGVVSMLQLAHQDHGKRDWELNFDAAKKLAIDGFAVSPRLHGMISRFSEYLPKTAAEGPRDAFDYFHSDDGQPLAVGHVLKNPDYAASLELISADPNAFYHGRIAKEIVAAVQQSPRAGNMQLSDLQNYQAVRRSALCVPYRKAQLCGPPPPSSWLAVGMIMGMLEKSHPFSSAGAVDPKNWSLFGEAQRLAYADRDRFVADSDSVLVPVKGLLHQDYLALRAGEISSTSAKRTIDAGDPWSFTDRLPAKAGVDATMDVPGTTHFVVVDKEGNVVSMTASVESIFGSTRMVGGMFLNNQLTDFSKTSKDAQGRDIANAVAGGKRPRSSMSPTIVLDNEGEFLLATGSPGGNSIIAYTAKTLS